MPDAGEPLLTDAQLDVVRRYGSVRAVVAGDVLISPGQADIQLSVVLSGEVDVIGGPRGREQVQFHHGPRAVAGELALLTGQRPLYTLQVTEDGSVLEIPQDRLRQLLARETEVAEIILQALIVRRQRQLRADREDPVVEVLGTRASEATVRVRSFLERSAIGYEWVDVDERADGDLLLEAQGATRSALPVVVLPTVVLHQATPGQVGEQLGLSFGGTTDRLVDVVVVGAGPSGLAAAVYGASEGLEVEVFDATAVGGQAARSSRIENYLGFPSGISGNDLTTRAMIQAARFGARLNTPCRIVDADLMPGGYRLYLDDRSSVSTRAIVLASGVTYRKLPLDGWERFEDAGIFYAATELEAAACAGGHVIVLGGGNSAGQAALFLATRCSQVSIVIRAADVSDSMSDYLIERIESAPLIDVLTRTVIDSVDGADRLSTVGLRATAGGETTHVEVSGLFCFIGAVPATDWLPDGHVRRDDKGFVLTDVSVPPREGARPRLPFETSCDGIFAVGDARLGSMKRVAAAVGEGSSAIRSVHQFLALCSDRDGTRDPVSAPHGPIARG